MERVPLWNDKRDEHLRSEDFFNVSKFPTLSFVSKKVIARDNRVATESPTRRAASAPVIQDEEEDVLDLETAGEVVEEVAAEGPLLPRETVSSISESLAALAPLVMA